MEKELPIEITEFSDYYDFPELFKHFWRCSLYNAWEHFDWDEAFEGTRRVIEAKLAEHGLTSYEDFVENEEGLYGDRRKNLEQFAVSTDYIYISEDDLYDLIMNYRYEQYKSAFEGLFSDLSELYEKSDNTYNMELPEKIELFDAIIHAQHVTGAIFDEMNPDDLRADVESEYESNNDIVKQFH